MKQSTIVFIIGIVLIGILIGVKLYLAKDNVKPKGKGDEPNADDIACASGGSSKKMIIGSCTKPKIFPVPSSIKQKCFNSETLGLSEGDLGPSKVTEAGGFGKTWYFNYQSGDRFCYTDKETY